MPYRDAALTMLLRDSFGGKSCTSVVINVAGEAQHAEETICSLRFGQRMSVVRNTPTVVVDSAADTSRTAGRAQQSLALCQRQLAQMQADGQGGGFARGAATHEKKMLVENMRNLKEQEQAVKRCVAEIAEARASGASTSLLGARMQTAQAQAEVLLSIVQRQQSIKGLWQQPTPAFARKAGEVKELESQVMMLV